MKFYEEEFNTLIKNLKSDLKNGRLDASYSIVGSALIESPFLLVGNNWGGNENQPSQTSMPLVNDILVEPKNSTYSGYINFFTDIFEGNKALSVQFLNTSVYTNGNLIRTPNEKSKYSELLETGRNLSEKYLKTIIEIVNPSTIICFGNSEDSATSAITKTLSNNNDLEFWKMESNNVVQTNNKWNTYQLKIHSNGKEYNIYSFPHASRYGTWNGNISKNSNFKSLQNLIKNLYL